MDFWPLVEELLRLMRGVTAFDHRNMPQFVLRAYMIALFGDMPAIAKLMRMKGHSGICPCRACRIPAIRDTTRERSTAHYALLHRNHGESYHPLNLPLSSLSLPSSFPHDLVLIIENIVPALINHWTGNFKDLDTGSHELPRSVADTIGEAGFV